MAPTFGTFHVNYRVLAIILIVALPALAIGSLIVLGTGQSRLREAYGQQLTQLAERTAAAADAYVFRRIIDVAILAKVPTVADAAASGSLAPSDPEVVRELDRQ